MIGDTFSPINRLMPAAFARMWGVAPAFWRMRLRIIKPAAREISGPELIPFSRAEDLREHLLVGGASIQRSDPRRDST